MGKTIDFINYKVRDAAILTNSYVAGNVLENCKTYNSLTINYKFTKGSLTDAQIKIEISNDNVSWHQLQTDSITSGVDTLTPLVYKLTADGNGSINKIYLNTKFIKISAIGTGTTTGSSLEIDGVLGVI